MRKSKSGDTQQDKPASNVPASVDEYIAGIEEPAGSMLVRMRALIRSSLPPEATEVISYRMPAFKLKKVLVWYAAFKDELKGFEIAKGTIHFPLNKPLPAALIKKIVKVRLQQALGSKRLSAL